MRTKALICKLEQFAKLSEEDKRHLEEMVHDVRTFDRRQDIIQEGDAPDHVHLMVEGWAARYKLRPNGEPAIMAYLIPGDFCDVQVSLLDRMDHSIRALSPCRIAFIPRAAITRRLVESPALSRALWWSTLLDEAILREWLVNVGHREAHQRMAHLICEMLLRSRAVGLTEDHSFELPVIQEELGDTMGLSTVHINRTLQDLRSQGLIASAGKRMIVHDLHRLMAVAEFDPTYLHQVNGQAGAANPGADQGTAQAGPS